MRALDQLHGVARTFGANRARSLLTLLGIMIGSGSIVLLAGLLRGGEEALIQTSQRASEADLVQVRQDDPPPKEAHKTRRDLSRRDQDNLEASQLLVGAGVATEANHEAEAHVMARKKRVRLVGAEPAAPALYHLEIEKGRFLSSDDLAERRRVCVVGLEVWRELLEERSDLTNLVITAEGQAWSVVGVLKNKPLLGGGGDGTWMWNRKVLVPQTTYDAIYAPSHEVGRLFVRLGGMGPLSKRLGGLERVVRQTLLRGHLGVENFKVEGEASTANQERMILSIIKLLLLGTGLLSLFVGGINIMNIMLVTVTERTREIGVRRAVGATPSMILVQFLLEAAFIAVTGGIIGVAGGILITFLLSLALSHWLGGWNMHVESWSILLGILLSLGTGIAFGLFPAWQAGRLDPVEALRYE